MSAGTMADSSRPNRWGQSGLSQDFDLNLAPIIDCFTVLIAFVMISTAFASIGIIDAGIVAGGEKPSETAQAADVRLRISLHKSGGAELSLSGKEAREIPVPPGKPEAITQSLDSIKAKWPGLKQVTLAADNDVPYQEVVAALETVRKTVPSVSLGGF